MYSENRLSLLTAKRLEGDRQTFPGSEGILDLQTIQSLLQLCQFTKNHFAIYLKWVNYMVCILYHNKDIKTIKALRGQIILRHCVTHRSILQNKLKEVLLVDGEWVQTETQISRKEWRTLEMANK